MTEPVTEPVTEPGTTPATAIPTESSTETDTEPATDEGCGSALMASTWMAVITAGMAVGLIRKRKER